MSDRLDALHDDIRFLRDLADSGRSPRLFGGSTLVAVGLIYGVASLAHGALAIGLFPGVSPWAFPWIWGVATLVFVAALLVLHRRLGARPGDAGSRAAALAWQAVGWTILALFACLQVVAWRTHSLAPLLLAPSIILALYGMAWMIAAGLTRQGWIWRTAATAYVAAVAAAALCLTPWVFLLFAVALVLLMVAPGLVLIRQARRG
jgi:hypothetical protein